MYQVEVEFKGRRTHARWAAVPRPPTRTAPTIDGVKLFAVKRVPRMTARVPARTIAAYVEKGYASRIPGHGSRP